jgi:hypothetical protein
MSEEWFTIKDLNSFIESTRNLIYNNFGQWNLSDDDDTDIVDSLVKSPPDKEEFDKLLSKEESLVIIKNLVVKQKNRRTKKSRYILSEDTFYTILEQLNSRLVSNIVKELVSKGLVESAYDSEKNDFVFWVKEDL